jgi:hypothetical protein
LTSKSTKSKKSSKSSKSGAKKEEKKTEEESKHATEEAKSQADGASKTDREGAAASEKGAAGVIENPGAEPVIKEKGWFTKQNVQNFIHYFIGEKAKAEKLTLVVGHAYQKFIEGLERPMKLNEMRIMKEPNYTKLREVLRDPRLYGDSIMRAFAEKSELVGVPSNTYHMVHEGFWDLYCRKPATPDLTARKLDGWINRIMLKAPLHAPPELPEGAEEGDVAEAQPTGLPVKAVVRIRIPFKRPEPAEGEAAEEGTEPPPKEDPVEVDPAEGDQELEEIDYEDRILAIPTQGDAYQVYVVHQVAQRLLREQIAKEFKEFLQPELAALDEEDMLTAVAKEAEQFEKDFFTVLYPDLPVFDFEKN